MLTILFLIFLLITLSLGKSAPGNLTDTFICKVSHLGVEYAGNIAKTESNVLCQAWSMDEPHKVNDNITDESFPDGSKKDARNFCRNPNKSPMGPWCYTMNTDLQFETCGIPLCSFTECKITGPGIEYGGIHNKGMSERNCLKWNKERKKVKFPDRTQSKLSKFSPDKFPDNNLNNAKKYCRNPDGDINGPWCLIENEDSGLIEKEYCDIPFCDDLECSMFSKNYDTYMHYTDFNESITNLTFSVKLWDSDSFPTATARLVLSLMPLPLTGKDINDLGIGIEIIIANNYTALRSGNKDKPEYEPTKGILKSTEYTTFALSWHRGFITLNLQGQIKPIFLAEIKTKKNLMGFKKDSFKYYSAQGTNILWNFPFCTEDFECDAHTTTGKDFQQFWPLREKSLGRDLYFYVRAFHSAMVLITTSPTSDYPYVKVILKDKNNHTRISLREHKDEAEVVLKDLDLENIVNYWEWGQFSISFFANTIQVYVKKEISLHTLVEAKYDVFRQMRWFSVSSDNTMAHWSFYCRPPPTSNPPPSLLPECALNKNEPSYKGTQDITSKGLPCLPWSGKKLIPDEAEKLFSKDNIFKAWNYCRDPEEKREGTFCYAISQNPQKVIEKQHCNLRRCKSELCKTAGTGNDFIGQMVTTRSNRTCDYWTYDPQRVHANHMFTYNESYFAEMNITRAKNYCRNPTRDLSGAWCFTTDPRVVQDVCNVKDCDKEEECIIIIATDLPGRKIYILPQWKESGLHGGLRFSVKEWNPDMLDGVIFSIQSKDERQEIAFYLGADHNQRVTLFYNNEMEQEKVFPHIISAGKWTDFWLQMRKGEIMLGYEGVPTSLFEWRTKDPNRLFEPMYLSYTTVFGKEMGLSFKCDECHTENTTTSSFKKFMPLGLWRPSENEVTYRNLTLKMRGDGIAWIPLMWVTNNLHSWSVSIDTREGFVSFYKIFTEPRSTVAKSQLLVNSHRIPNVMTVNNWTTFFISFNDSIIEVKRNNETVLYYQALEPILGYWFSVAASVGWVTWSANCEPVDLDGPPRDGGWSAWSSWTCSVSCGGGEGFRTRTCSNPHPNIFGKLCIGSPTMSGKCNDFPCGDISPETIDTIREHLQKTQLSYLINEDDSLLLKNEKSLLKLISKESPEAYYKWSHNGFYIDTENPNVQIKGDDVFIKNAKVKDAGVYICMLYRINKKRVIFHVLTVAVISKNYDLNTRATRDYTFQSNAVVLGYIYTDLSMKILVDNRVYLDHGTTVLAAVHTHYVKSLNKSHSGDWKFVVEHKDLKLTWVTNYFRVKVKKAPNFYTNLMEDKLTAPIFGNLKTETNVLIAVIGIVIFVVLIVSLGLFIYFKFCTLKPKYKRNRRK